MEPDDVAFAWEMLWEVVAVSEESRRLGKAAALASPGVRRYLDGGGRAGDAGVVALNETGRRRGAACFRLFAADEPGYGFVAEDVPELAIGVAADARGMGVGTALLGALLDAARTEGFRALSLGVDRRNPARRLYERMGFRDVGGSPTDDEAVTLVIRLLDIDDEGREQRPSV